MRGISGVVRAAGGRFPIGGGPGKRGATRFTARSGSGSVSFSSASAPGSSSSSAAPGQGPVILKAAVTCAGLGVVGDVLAQTITNRSLAKATAATAKPGGKKGAGTSSTAPTTPLDLVRTARQCAYNFVFYGPAQHFWYGALAGFFPTNSAAGLAANFRPFAAKVFLNQAVLGPVVVTTFFAWTFALQGKMSEYPEKIRRDALPTLKRGWAFWVPAASVNFAVVPLRFQVLYMSCCSIVWNYILSTAAGKNNQPAPVAAKKGR